MFQLRLALLEQSAACAHATVAAVPCHNSRRARQAPAQLLAGGWLTSESACCRCQDRAGPLRAVEYASDTTRDFTPSDDQHQVPKFATVEDIMTKGRIFTVHEDTSIDEALEILVQNRITGLPVVNDDDVVVGVVSDFDMLTLDAISGKARYEQSGIFPDTNTDWSTFFELQKLLMKNQGKTVMDVMTHNPLVVRGNTDLEGAARLLLERHIRRMPVVDSDGRLVGVFSRGDVIRAALAQRKAVMQQTLDKSGKEVPEAPRESLRGD